MNIVDFQSVASEYTYTYIPTCLPVLLKTPTLAILTLSVLTAQFVNHYYTTFDSDRKSLAALYVRFRPHTHSCWTLERISVSERAGKYVKQRLTMNLPKQQRENSMLTFESSQSLGAASILEKLTVR